MCNSQRTLHIVFYSLHSFRLYDQVFQLFHSLWREREMRRALFHWWFGCHLTVKSTCKIDTIKFVTMFVRRHCKTATRFYTTSFDSHRLLSFGHFLFFRSRKTFSVPFWAQAHTAHASIEFHILIFFFSRLPAPCMSLAFSFNQRKQSSRLYRMQ